MLFKQIAICLSLLASSATAADAKTNEASTSDIQTITAREKVDAPMIASGAQVKFTHQGKPRAIVPSLRPERRRAKAKPGKAARAKSQKDRNPFDPQDRNPESFNPQDRNPEPFNPQDRYSFDPNETCIVPDCNWEQGETYTFDGKNGECVVPSSASNERPLWYSLEEGTANVYSLR